MLTEDPLQRPSAINILEKLKTTKFKYLVIDLPQFPEKINITSIKKNSGISEGVSTKGSKTLDVSKAHGFVFPFENEDQHTIEFPFQLKKEEYEDIFKLNEKIKEESLLKETKTALKPQLLFDASSPSFFPILKESEINPKSKKKKKKRGILKLNEIGNILEMVSKEPLVTKEVLEEPQASTSLAPDSGQVSSNLQNKSKCFTKQI
jgi:hypothetical protein